MKTNAYRVEPGASLKLEHYATRADGGWTKEEGKAELDKLHARLVELDELHYADGRHALLVVFQGMDTSGKDGTIRKVFSGLDPSGMRVVSFKAPSTLELSHDFLWRIHQHAPPRGHVAVFNRSHYEDVLVVRAKRLVPESVWRGRYDTINAFEHGLTCAGTRIVKFFLHISKDFQRERLQKRIDDPSKHWKLNPGDLEERKRWDDYMAAYEEALQRCSTEEAPWYIVPAERRWFRDLLVAQVLVELLESLELKYPQPSFDPRELIIP